MKGTKSTCLVAGVLLVAQLLGGSPAAQATPSSAGNGYLMMVHASFAPNVYNASSAAVPPAPEAVATTNAGGSIVFNVIPHGLDGFAAIVSEPVLAISATGGTKRLELAPNGDPTQQAECAIETQAPGFAGPLDACLVFRVDATWFEGVPLVDLALHFNDTSGPQVQVNSLAGHLAVHAYQGGAPVQLSHVDANTDATVTPFVVEYLVDPTG